MCTMTARLDQNTHTHAHTQRTGRMPDHTNTLEYVTAVDVYNNFKVNKRVCLRKTRRFGWRMTRQWGGRQNEQSVCKKKKKIFLLTAS